MDTIIILIVLILTQILNVYLIKKVLIRQNEENVVEFNKESPYASGNFYSNKVINEEE